MAAKHKEEATALTTVEINEKSEGCQACVICVLDCTGSCGQVTSIIN